MRLNQLTCLVFLVYSPLHASEDKGWGVCIGNHLNIVNVCDYSINVMWKKGSRPHSIILKKKIGEDYDGEVRKPVWKILDEISAPTIPKEAAITLGSCKLHHSPNDSVLAVIIRNGSGWVKAEGWAAIADIQSEKIKLIAPTDVECKSTGKLL